jgi:hypothetical protein
MSLRLATSAGNFLTSWGTVSLSRRTLIHGVSWYTALCNAEKKYWGQIADVHGMVRSYQQLTGGLNTVFPLKLHHNVCETGDFSREIFSPKRDFTMRMVLSDNLLDQDQRCTILNCWRFIWIIISGTQQYRWRCTYLRRWLKNQALNSGETKSPYPSALSS